ncbi:bifunctional protein-serine/threonine kinase/phosphatase [Uliginosibacterium sp. H1]|uniref:bifunctional protein-serine/threonine kinase/phosphatase n=1 Tax=Uliginosibacterium sp. H1 TaxID=3114757 RepID=UPI002E16E11C|nr:bifunctional protein-serine/threonine kinase/phosphatase [Uliginosibacterium sp. H1]
MSGELRVSIGQHSDKGRKPLNQDFHGACVPTGAQLVSKGVALALADGISSSEVSQVASEFAVRGFLDDYYCTSDAWSVKTAAQRVLAATNSWLFAQTQRSEYRFDRDRGYVCTFSAVVVKGSSAHLLHVGDTRIYRVHEQSLEQLTDDHRVHAGGGQSYLGRALGASRELEIDYRTLTLDEGDVLLLATDGVYEHVDPRTAARIIRENAGDLDHAARLIVAEAFARDSTDNLSVQILRVDSLPGHSADALYHHLAGLPFPPLLQARMHFDGYRIERELHHSHRSHLYLATDEESGERVVIKTLATELQADPGSVERFLLEEWVARRIDNAHVLKPRGQARKRGYLYVVMEYVDGHSLAQWMTDHPRPSLNAVRDIVDQIAAGLQAFHRMEMVHRDLRPPNVMVDAAGTLKIIDFGSTRVAGIMEAAAPKQAGAMLATAQYAAPELFLGEEGDARSDVFSLAVVAYQLLTGRLPYGTRVAAARTRAEQARLRYDSALSDERDIPAWVDEVLRKALHPDPRKRYGELSEFTYDLRHPGATALGPRHTPLIERNPLLFWKLLSLLLAVALVLALCLPRMR